MYCENLTSEYSCHYTYKLIFLAYNSISHQTAVQTFTIQFKGFVLFLCKQLK